jgi:hypothetical protein
MGREVQSFGVVVIGLAVTVSCAGKVITRDGGLAAKGENRTGDDSGKPVGLPTGRVDYASTTVIVGNDPGTPPKDAGHSAAPPTDAGRSTAPPTDASEAACHFEYLGDWIRCEHAGWPNVEHVDAARYLEDCMTSCSKRPDCTAVTDYFYLKQDPPLGCYLYTSTCNAPCSPNFAMEDGGKDYRKVCDGSSSKGWAVSDAMVDGLGDD